MALLLALLVVAYIGSLWVSAGGGRSFGSPSGAEYVVLGCLLGPRALGVVGDDALVSFEPVAHVALGWIALGYGLECGMVGDRPARLSRNLLAIAFTAVTASMAALSVFYAAMKLGLPANDGTLTLAFALGLVSAETTRHALRWVSERHIAEGTLSELVAELAATDDAFVLMALSFLFAIVTGSLEVGEERIPPAGAAGATLALGIVLGGAASFLVSRAPRRVEWWTVLLGGAFLAIGATTRLGLSSMAAAFAMGLAISITSGQHGRELRAMVASTEGPVLLPALLLAGAHLSLPGNWTEGLLAAVAVGARVVSNVVTGTALAVVRPSTRPATPWLGLGMLSSGTLTMMVGFSLLLRFEGTVGRLALLVAALGTGVGELVGPFALRRALARAGELTQRDSTAPEVSP